MAGKMDKEARNTSLVMLGVCGAVGLLGWFVDWMEGVKWFWWTADTILVLLVGWVVLYIARGLLRIKRQEAAEKAPLKVRPEHQKHTLGVGAALPAPSSLRHGAQSS